MSEVPAVTQRWLWPNRIPLRGMTLLDGDLGCCKSLLALQLAAHVSSGRPLPDGSATVQGGVVIIAPYEDAATIMRERLVAYGADLSRIRVLSLVRELSPTGERAFQLHEDINLLAQVMGEIDARLVIVDPITAVLPTTRGFQQTKLQPLLNALRALMVRHEAACLLIRQCPAKGGIARPSALERSQHFNNNAASHLLLARDPIDADRFVLGHVANRLGKLTPTLCLQVTSAEETPQLGRIIVAGSLPLFAQELLSQRPTLLQGILLVRKMNALSAGAEQPVSRDTLRQHFPSLPPGRLHSLLRSLVRRDALICPTRNFYALPPPSHDKKDV